MMQILVDIRLWYIYTPVDVTGKSLEYFFSLASTCLANEIKHSYIKQMPVASLYGLHTCLVCIHPLVPFSY